MTTITILTTAIRQLDGLYSLNDLHHAAGGDDKYKPANFMRLDNTQALIAEIQCSHVSTAHKTINGGPTRGTYVCRELVYAYAMWISAKFSLIVIRAFDALHTPSATTPTPALPPPDTLTRTERRFINQRAWHFAQDAYESTRERIAEVAAGIPDPVRRLADIARWQPYHYPVERPSAGAIAALLAELSAAGHDLAACQADLAALIERGDLAGEILHHVARLSNEGLARLTERALTLAAMPGLDRRG